MRIRTLFLLACLALSAAAALSHGNEEHLMGMVTALTRTTITVKTTAKEPVTVGVGPATKFIHNKKPAKISELSAGDRVVIHAVKGPDGKLVASSVEFATAAKPPQGGGTAPAPKPAAPAAAR